MPRQLLTAVSRSAGVISNRMSFSASAKVAAETGGPALGAVPKAVGAPGGGTVGEIDVGLLHAAMDARSVLDAALKNLRRVSGWFISHIVEHR